jgi:hypothetical protein
MKWNYEFSVSDDKEKDFIPIYSKTFRQPQKATHLLKVLGTVSFVEIVTDSGYVMVDERIDDVLISSTVYKNKTVMDMIFDRDKREKSRIKTRLRLNNIPPCGLTEYLDTQHHNFFPSAKDITERLSKADIGKIEYYKTSRYNIVFDVYYLRGDKMCGSVQYSMGAIRAMKTYLERHNNLINNGQIIR